MSFKTKKDLIKFWLESDGKPFFIEYEDQDGNWLVRSLIDFEFEYKKPYTYGEKKWAFTARIKGGKKAVNVTALNKLRKTDKTKLSPIVPLKPKIGIKNYTKPIQDKFGNDVKIGDYVYYNCYSEMKVCELVSMQRRISNKTNEETSFQAKFLFREPNYRAQQNLSSRNKGRQFKEIIKMNDEDRLIYVLKN